MKKRTLSEKTIDEMFELAEHKALMLQIQEANIPTIKDEEDRKAMMTISNILLDDLQKSIEKAAKKWAKRA